MIMMRLAALLLLPGLATAQVVRDVPTCPDELPDGFSCVDGRVTSEQAVLECPPPEEMPEGFACIETLTITRTTEPPVEPPVEPPPVEPPPGGGAHAHFDAVAASAHAIESWSLRDPSHIEPPPVGIGGKHAASSGYYQIDPVRDATRLTLSRATHVGAGRDDAGAGIWGNWNLVIQHEPVGLAEGNSAYSAQIEVRMGSGYSDASAAAMGWTGSNKWLTHRTPRQNKLAELLVQMGADFAARPALRLYMSKDYIDEPCIEDSIVRVRCPDGARDYQPSDQSAAYQSDQPFTIATVGQPDKPALVPHDEWCRITVHVTFENDAVGYAYYIACESFDPIRYLSSKASPGEPLIATHPDRQRNTIAMWYIPEHGCSTCGQFGDTGIVLESWYRNAVVWKDALIPLGGRPGDS